MGRKSPGQGPYPDCWLLPGGGLNFGKENAVEALEREVKEEANIEITDVEQLCFDEDLEKNKNGEMTHYIFLIFKAKHKSGMLRAGDDMASLEWIDKSRLKELKHNRSSIRLFKRLGYL